MAQWTVPLVESDSVALAAVAAEAVRAVAAEAAEAVARAGANTAQDAVMATDQELAAYGSAVAAEFVLDRARLSSVESANTSQDAAIAARAVDADVVHDTGAELVAGVKTFASAPVVPDGSFSAAKLSFDPATQAELDAHVADVTDAHDATAISFTPAGSISAIDVQAAISEVAAEAASGPAGGVLGGTYPNPGFAADMATQAELDAVAAAPNVQTFLAAGTWNEPAGARMVNIRIVGPGSAGASGRKGAAGTIRGGGQGGGSGGRLNVTLPASVVPATLTVSNMNGGVGGVAQATNSTDGNPPTNASVVTVTGTGLTVRVATGNSAGGGTATGNTPGLGSGGYPVFSEGATGANGGSSSATGLTGAGGGTSFVGTSGAGASGGGITAANAASNGASGGSAGGYVAGGTAGLIDGAVPTAGTAGGTGVGDAAMGSPAGGGGGGAASITTNAQAGANGGFPGGGGGGGGAALNDVGNSGAGGNGANGIVVITSYF